MPPTVIVVLDLERRNHEENERSSNPTAPFESKQATTLQPKLTTVATTTHLLCHHSNDLFGAFNALQRSEQRVLEPAVCRRDLDLGVVSSSTSNDLVGMTSSATEYQQVAGMLCLVESFRNCGLYRQHLTEFLPSLPHGFCSNLNFPFKFKVFFICLLPSRIFHSLAFQKLPRGF